MAKVEIKPAVIRTVVKVVEEEQVVLILSLDEARALRALTGSVIGPPQDSIRQHTDNVLDALRAAGVKDGGDRWYKSVTSKPCVEGFAT